jgi:putative hydrolase of the HAD superfamily
MVPKPAEEPYLKFLDSHDVEPINAAMFEDMPRNLDVPKKFGMRTVLVTPAQDSQHSAEPWELAVVQDESIDFATDHLDDFLADLLEALN